LVGARLDRVLAEHEEVESRSEAERLIASGAVTVDGTTRPKSYRLDLDEEVVAVLPPDRELRAEALDIPIVWEDEHLLVVDKPAGIVVHPAGGHTTGTLVHGLLAHGAEGGEEDRPGIVHRLDRDTSGLLVVARSEEAHGRLQQMIRERAIERRYTALVVGRPASRSGRIEAPIGRDRRDRTRISLDSPDPRDAVTWFEVVETLARHALLDVRLETGRTHQIRVHLEAIGLPVAGDPVYGAARELALGRQFLHASRLAFTHPWTGEALDLMSGLPADLSAALALARA
jgi:23S rRNA pseudouridine1911/1915/1917 synthase